MPVVPGVVGFRAGGGRVVVDAPLRVTVVPDVVVASLVDDTIQATVTPPSIVAVED